MADDGTVKNEGEVRLTVLSGGGARGKTIEEMAASGEVVDGIPDPIKGSQPQLSFDVYSDELSVTRSTLKGKLPTSFSVEGQFQPGDEFTLELRLRVANIHHDEITDRYGNGLGMERVHVAKTKSWRLRNEARKGNGHLDMNAVLDEIEAMYDPEGNNKALQEFLAGAREKK